MESKQYIYEQQIKKELNKLQIEKLENDIYQMKKQIKRDLEDEDDMIREIEELKRVHEDLLIEHHKLSVHYRNPTKRPREWEVQEKYRSRDHKAFLDYIFDNKLCIHDFLHYYKIPLQSTGTEAGPCSTYHKGHYWHAVDMKQRFPLGYSKHAALCQVTHVLHDRGRLEDARKLYKAILEDKDGFFSSDVAPLD